MRIEVPRTSILLMFSAYKKILPQVRRELKMWRSKANGIPDEELRTQALDSMNAKGFHCQGGAIYALLAGVNWKKAIRFIVAYQTISDYLDNLCDRSTSLDPDDFTQLHLSMKDALNPLPALTDYYAFRSEKEDGGYLEELVACCREIIAEIPGADAAFHQHADRLRSLYCSLQVHKHVKKEERVPRLVNWFIQEELDAPLHWQEFAAASGSTLGIFCMVSYALSGKCSGELLKRVHRAYFPFVQGLHIMLDYYIDQAEDAAEGDLNFCSFYDGTQALRKRMQYLITGARQRVQDLPDTEFHQMVISGLVGLYLSDPKVKALTGSGALKKAWLKDSGPGSLFFYWNTRIYYAMVEQMR